MPQRSIGAQVQIISPVAGFDVFGQNYGSTLIYVSANPSVSPTSFDQVLTPGSTIDWPANKGALYLATDPGVGALLNYSTDGTRVTGSSVTIASGSVVTTSANAPVLLYRQQQSLLGTVGRQAFGPFIPLDVSTYTSVLISVNNSWPPTLDTTNWLEVNPRQSTDFLVNSPIDQLSAQWLIDGTSPSGPVAAQINSAMSYQIPVTKPNLFCVLAANVTTAFAVPANSPLTLSIYGTHETIAAPKYVNASQQLMGLAAYGGLYERRMLTVRDTQYLQNKNGVAQVATWQEDVNAYVITQLAVLDSGVVKIIGQQTIPSGTAYQQAISQSVLLPARPLQVNFIQTGATSAAFFSLVQ